jgi:hypothetical protein
MIKHRDSHVDHNLTEQQLHYLLDRFTDRNAFFLETIELPEQLGTVPCGLWGPIMGDPPVDETEVRHEQRGNRAWTSRIVERQTRQTRRITVIAGPHEEHACVLFTAFGGPASPQEPGDPRCKDPAASAAFWREHALAK